MTDVILTAVEIERETAALAQAETFRQALARRKAERMADKLVAMHRIATRITQASATPPALT